MEQASETKTKITLYYQSQLLNQCLLNLLLSQTYNANSRLKLQRRDGIVVSKHTRLVFKIKILPTSIFKHQCDILG